MKVAEHRRKDRPSVSSRHIQSCESPGVRPYLLKWRRRYRRARSRGSGGVRDKGCSSFIRKIKSSRRYPEVYPPQRSGSPPHEASRAGWLRERSSNRTRAGRHAFTCRSRGSGHGLALAGPASTNDPTAARNAGPQGPSQFPPRRARAASGVYLVAKAPRAQ